MSHRLRYGTKDTKLCPRGKTRQGEGMASYYDANGLDVRIGHGDWDIERH